MKGTLSALVAANKNVSAKVEEIKLVLKKYEDLFYSKDLDPNNFETLWAALKKGDELQGPTKAKGYPATLQSYYSLDVNAEQVELSARDWMVLDMPVTLDLARRIGLSLKLGSDASLQTVWDAL